MGAGRTVAVVSLGVLLTLTLSVGNVVFAAHATILDPDFATDTIDEEGGYEALAGQVEQGVTGTSALSSENDSDDAIDAGASSVDEVIDREKALADALSPAYVEAQVEPNVHRIYAYLHGNRDRLNLTLDTEPLVATVSAAAEASIENATTAELLALTEGDPLGDVPVDRSTIAMLDQGPDAYAQAQQDVRDRVYERVLDEAVERAYTERSNDELLALVIPDYDPDEYSESEKEGLVADHEAEIRSALRSSIERERGDELEATVDDRLATYREDAGTNVSTGVASLDGPVSELTRVTATALTTDMSYGTYQSQAAAARADLATAVGDYVETTLTEELGARVDLNEATGIPEEDAFSGARSTVTWFDRLAIGLPALALVLIGLVWYLTRSVGRTLGTVGWSMVWTGVPAFAGASFLDDRLPAMLGSGGDPTAMQAVTLGLFRATVGHAAAQSLAIGAVGTLFVGAALGMRYDLLDRVRDEDVETADGEIVEGEMVESEGVETRGTGDPLTDGSGGSVDARNGDETPIAGSRQTDSTDSGSSQQDDR